KYYQAPDYPLHEKPYAGPSDHWKYEPINGLSALKGTDKEVFVIGDVHGDLKALRETLIGLGIVEPGDHPGGLEDKWKIPNAVVIQGGDVVDRGPDSFLSIEYLRYLQEIAPSHDSEVVRLLGNHELCYLLKHAGGKWQGVIEEFYETRVKTPDGSVRRLLEGLTLWEESGKVAEMVKEDVRKGRLKASYAIGGKVFTHGLVTDALISRLQRGYDLEMGVKSGKGLFKRFARFLSLQSQPLRLALKKFGIETRLPMEIPETFAAGTNRILKEAVEKESYDNIIFSMAKGVISEHINGLTGLYYSHVENDMINALPFDNIVFHDPSGFESTGKIPVIRNASTGHCVVGADVGMCDYYGSGRGAVVFRDGKALAAYRKKLNNSLNIDTEGQAMIIVGASGAGKSTLMNRLLDEHPDVFDIPDVYTTRESRNGLEDRNKVSVTEETFEFLRSRNELAMVRKSHGNWYGIPRDELRRTSGKISLFDTSSLTSLYMIRKLYPYARVVFISHIDSDDMRSDEPDTVEEFMASLQEYVRDGDNGEKIRSVLRQRMRARGGMSDGDIEVRVEDAVLFLDEVSRMGPDMVFFNSDAMEFDVNYNAFIKMVPRLFDKGLSEEKAAVSRAEAPRKYTLNGKVIGVLDPVTKEIIIDMRGALSEAVKAAPWLSGKENRITGYVHAHEIFHRILEIKGVNISETAEERLAGVFATRALGGRPGLLDGMLFFMFRLRMFFSDRELARTLNMKYDSPAFLLAMSKLGLDIYNVSDSWESVEIPEVEGLSGERGGFYVVGDIHADLEAFRDILAGLGLIRKGAGSDGLNDIWTGGNARLLQGGDTVDRGPDPLKTFKYLRYLQDSARDNGGEVIRLLGNHELFYLLKYAGGKWDGAVQALIDLKQIRHIDPVLWEDDSEFVRMLREDIEAGRVVANYSAGGKLFSHGVIKSSLYGVLHNRTDGAVKDPAVFARILNSILKASVRRGDFDDTVFSVCGGVLSRWIEGFASVYFSRVLDSDVSVVPFDQVVFHDPSFFEENSRIGFKVFANGHTIINGDVGMSSSFNSGRAAILFDRGKTFAMYSRIAADGRIDPWVSGARDETDVIEDLEDAGIKPLPDDEPGSFDDTGYASLSWLGKALFGRYSPILHAPFFEDPLRLGAPFLLYYMLGIFLPESVGHFIFFSSLLAVEAGFVVLHLFNKADRYTVGSLLRGSLEVLGLSTGRYGTGEHRHRIPLKLGDIAVSLRGIYDSLSVRERFSVLTAPAAAALSGVIFSLVFFSEPVKVMLLGIIFHFIMNWMVSLIRIIFGVDAGFASLGPGDKLPEDRVEIPGKSYSVKPEREMNERFAEKNASIDMQNDIAAVYSDLLLSGAARDRGVSSDREEDRISEEELVGKIRTLYLDMPVDIRKGEPFGFYSKALKELRARRECIYRKIEKADRENDTTSLNRLNREAIRNNR
ncbi:MAG: hypothetical protein GF408_02935, partial [Candidatus Omnitrophica bacterium]|nr:hypothetical protein [Candidatus Omnitrophota bacterium]